MMRVNRIFAILVGTVIAAPSGENKLVRRDACKDTCSGRDYGIAILSGGGIKPGPMAVIAPADFDHTKASSNDLSTNICGDYKDGDNHMGKIWTVMCDENGVPNGFSGPEGEGSCWAPIGDTQCTISTSLGPILDDIKACCDIGPLPPPPPPPPPPPSTPVPPPETGVGVSVIGWTTISATPTCAWGCTGWNCDEESPCSSGLSCIGGTCQKCDWGCPGWNCDDKSPCQKGFSCNSGKCGAPQSSPTPQPSSTPGECDWGCKGWKCDDKMPCQKGLSCDNNICMEPSQGSGNPACTWGCKGWDCDGGTPCQSGLSCTKNVCTEPGDGDSPDCTWGCKGWDCNGNSPCQEGLSCISNVCKDDGEGDGDGDSPGCTWGCIGWICAAGVPCQPGFSCVSGICNLPGGSPGGGSPDCKWGCDGWKCSAKQPCQDGYVCTQGRCKKRDDHNTTKKPGSTLETSRNSPSSTFTRTPSSSIISSIESSSTSFDDVCNIGKRAIPPATPYTWLDPETRVECLRSGHGKVTHITSTSRNVGSYPKVIGIKCPQECGQACYNYRSIMSVHTATDDMVRFTCQKHPESYTNGNFGGKNGQATNRWGATALGGAVGDHWWPWANGFISFSQDPTAPQKTAGCQRDEFPPRYFWPGDRAAKKRNMEQRVRMIPHDDNECGGRLWRGFCNDNNASSKKPGSNEDEVQSQFLRVVKKWTRSVTDPKFPFTTSYTTLSIQTARAVFTIDDWDGLPNDPYDGLKLNKKCWPEDLAPDPGWALLTKDEYYQRAPGNQFQAETKKYRGLPDLAKVQAALAKNGGHPPFSFKSFQDNDAFKASQQKNKWRIPDAYRDGGTVLPGLPAPPPPPPKMRMRRDGNETLEDRGATDRMDSWSEDEVLEGYTDEELDQWMAEYIELMARSEDNEIEASRTIPRETEAEATPVGEVDLATAPAVGKSVADAEMPWATGGV